MSTVKAMTGVDVIDPKRYRAEPRQMRAGHGNWLVALGGRRVRSLFDGATVSDAGLLASR